MNTSVCWVLYDKMVELSKHMMLHYTRLKVSLLLFCLNSRFIRFAIKYILNLFLLKNTHPWPTIHFSESGTAIYKFICIQKTACDWTCVEHENSLIQIYLHKKCEYGKFNRYTPNYISSSWRKHCNWSESVKLFTQTKNPNCRKNIL